MRTTPTPSFDMMDCIRRLVACGQRQLEGETQARAYLISVLDDAGISYSLQTFTTEIPVMESAELVCDGASVPAEACSFVSGDIPGKDVIVSSAMPSRYCSDVPNISFNPSCPVLSPGNHYFAPAVTVSHETLQKVLAATSVRGSVRVRKVEHESANILVGSTTNPRVLCFAHYDSVKLGAIDNASGVAVLMAAAFRNPSLLEDCLFVFAGNEELSYDNPTYWGRGFRELEKAKPQLFAGAEKIVTVDCVGNGVPQTITDPGIVSRAFPLANANEYTNKTILITGDFEQLMTVYHSELDDGRGIDPQMLEASLDQLARSITKVTT